MPGLGESRLAKSLSRVLSLVDHRHHVSREDIKTVAKPSPWHRLFLDFEGRIERINPDDVIETMLEEVEAPAMAV